MESQLAINAPIYAVWFAGLVLALIRRRRHPRASWLTAVAIGLLLVTSVVLSIVWPNFVIPLLVKDWGLSLSQIEQVFLAVGVVRSVIYAVAWVLITVAIFGGRGQDRAVTIPSDPS